MPFHLFKKAKASKKGVPAPKAPRMHPVDLRLPQTKKPERLDQLSYYKSPRTVKSIVSCYAIGSSTPGKRVYHERDLGLFQTVYEAWKNHFNLRTSPEDWWFPVACKVAKAIDKVARDNGSAGEKVRDFFVDHKGKDKICVDMGVLTIDQVDPDDLFSQMAAQISSRIKVPEYADALQNDFSTSAAKHQIASQINLMASMQEFFSYEMGICGCGIKGIEMCGNQCDWDRLAEKLRLLEDQLKPLWDCLRWELSGDWWSHVGRVFDKLSKTYAAKRSRQLSEVADFWADIFMVGEGWKYGPSGNIGGSPAEEYNGWLIKFLTGEKSMLKEDFLGKRNLNHLSGMNSVPMKITKKYESPEVSDQGNLTAGIMGFELHEDGTFNGVPSLQPHHMWALELPLNSPLRG